MRDFTSWAGLSRSNHISSVFGVNQQQATSTMIRLMEKNYGKSLESWLSRWPTKYFEEDEDITWKLIGSPRRNLPLVEARDLSGVVITSGAGMVGVHEEPFYLTFSEDYFFDGNILFGEKNEIYPMRVLGDARVEGSRYTYKVELLGAHDGIPRDELVAGKRFSAHWSPVEKDFSRKVGGVRYAGPISMRNEFSRVRISTEVPGSMLNKKVAMGIPMYDSQQKKEVVFSRWMHVVEWEAEQQFSEDKNYCLVYGRSNRTGNGEYYNFGKSGNILQTGAGIREQQSYGNTYYYNDFSLKLIEDCLFELLTGVVDFRNRAVVLETGERGALLFHKAVLDYTSGWQAFNYLRAEAPAVIHKTSSEMHSNALSAGFQFVEFKAPMGVTVTVKVNPFYDDQVMNKVPHPMGGVANSYRFDLYYLGSPTEPNIQLARIKGKEEVRGYQWGLINPFTGQMGNENMSFDEDKAVFHKMAWLGALVLDPNRTLSLIPSVLAM